MNIAILFTGRANPWPSSGAIRYSTGKLRSRRAITSCSASARLTRGSLAPCTTISAVLILSAEFSGERSFIHALPASVPGSAMRTYICLRAASQYGGMASSRVSRFDGPTMSTAARYKSGVNATPASVAYPPYDPKRVGILGGSYGGYAVLAGVAFTPDVYRAAVDIVGPSNLLTLLDAIPAYWEAGRKQMYARM